MNGPASSSPHRSSAAYLENPLRIGAILGSFAVLCIPLAVLQISVSSPAIGTVGVVTYAVLLGATHFVIYLHVMNRGALGVRSPFDRL